MADETLAFASPFAAADPGDRELLRNEIRALRHEWSVLRSDLSDTGKKLGDVIPGRLDGEPSTPETAAVDHQDAVLRSQSSLKNLETFYLVKIRGLASTVKILEEELSISEKKAKDAAEEKERELAARDAEMQSVTRAIEENCLRLVAENAELWSKMEKQRVPPGRSNDLGPAMAIGLGALAAAAVVFLPLTKQW